MNGTRLDVDAMLGAEPLRGILQQVLLAPRDSVRHARLSELKALLVVATREQLRGAPRGPVTAVVGTSSPGDLFPARADELTALATRAGLPGTEAWRRVSRWRAGRGRLGVRGLRFLLGQRPLLANVARALMEACGEAAEGGAPAHLRLVLHGVTFAAELAAARRLLERFRHEVAADLGAPLLLEVGVQVSCLRALTGPELGADFVERDAEGLAETLLGLSRADTEQYRDRVRAQGLLPADPFDREDALLEGSLAELIAAGHELSRVMGAPPPPAPAGDALGVVEELVARVGRGELEPAAGLAGLSLEIVDGLSRPFLVPGGARPLGGGRGVTAGGGAGRLALSVEAARRYAAAGEAYVLVVPEVLGDEAHAVRGAQGLVTQRGGATSHAAMVAANSGVPCLVAEGLHLDLAARSLTLGGVTLAEGEALSVDGSRGLVFAGALPVELGHESAAFREVMSWAAAAARMEVLANADDPAEAAVGIEAGAAGVGLVRSEHMLLEPERLQALRQVVLGDDARRRVALEELRRLQEADFCGWFRALGTHPVVFRLLDAPLHEFLPHDRAGVQALALHMGRPLEEVAEKVDRARGRDPMMGVRGVRLALVLPELEAVQVEALTAAWLRVRGEGGAPAPLAVLIPMVSGAGELGAATARVRGRVADLGGEVPLRLGAMLEIPRAALDARALARHVDFCAWGTNDLTQFGLGLSRDLAEATLATWKQAGVALEDPGRTLDPRGAGALVAVGSARARAGVPGLRLGVCGNHAADPRSVVAFERLGLDYLSVPPAQVARARLAAAQAVVRGGERD